jgi:hypothetical protein
MSPDCYRYLWADPSTASRFRYLSLWINLLPIFLIFTLSLCPWPIPPLPSPPGSPLLPDPTQRRWVSGVGKQKAPRMVFRPGVRLGQGHRRTRAPSRPCGPLSGSLCAPLSHGRADRGDDRGSVERSTGSCQLRLKLGEHLSQAGLFIRRPRSHSTRYTTTCFSSNRCGGRPAWSQGDRKHKGHYRTQGTTTFSLPPPPSPPWSRPRPA